MSSLDVVVVGFVIEEQERLQSADTDLTRYSGTAGVLAIGGPTVFPGYVVARAEHGHVLDGLGKLRDGWLDTGDLARVDAVAFVHLTGRAKDLIIRGGHNIEPAVIEDALLAWAADRVPERAAVPKAVTVLEALPVTDIGKPCKLALRAAATRRAIDEPSTRRSPRSVGWTSTRSSRTVLSSRPLPRRPKWTSRR